LHASNIEDCAAELAAKLDLEVELDLSIAADVDVDVGDDKGSKDDDKDVEDKADDVADDVDDACSVGPLGAVHTQPKHTALAMFGLVALGAAFSARRRTRAAAKACTEKR
jgi:sugar-specific transcriptional regulator TrmB